MSRLGRVAAVLVSACVIGRRGAEGLDVNGSGGSVLAPLFNAWMPAYTATPEAQAANLTLSYKRANSGVGIRDLTANDTYWAGGEVVIAEENYIPGMRMLPVSSSPVVLVFNLNGSTTGLILTRSLVARIFSFDIRWWDDAGIQASNPGVSLPHREIELVSRGDPTGTSFVMTTTLVSFGWLDTPGCKRSGRCTVTKNLHTLGFPFTLVRSTREATLYVKNTPFTMGYVGVATALQELVPFAILENKAGALTVASRHSAEISCNNADYHPVRMTAAVHDKLGYPILGISYLIYWQKYSPAIALRQLHGRDPTASDLELACQKYEATLRFMYWVYTSPQSTDIVKSARLVPMTNQIGNRVLGKLWDSQCGERRWKTRDSMVSVVTFDQTTDMLANELSFAYHTGMTPDSVVKTNLRSFVQYTEASEALQEVKAVLALRSAGPELAFARGGVAYEGANPASALTWVPIVSSPLVIVGQIGVPGLQATLIAEVTDLIALLSGTATTWATGSIHDRNAHLPLPTSVVFVGHESMFLPVLSKLGMSVRQFRATRRALVNITSEQEVAEYVANTKGSLAVLSFRVQKMWGLALVHPVLKGSLTEVTPTDKEYPFQSVLYVGIPKVLRTRHAQGDMVPALPHASIVSAIRFAQWLTGAQPQGEPTLGADTGHYSAPLLENVGELHIRNETLLSMVNRFFTEITVDGAPLYPAPPAPEPPAGNEKVFLIASLIGGGFALLVAVGALAATRKYFRDTAQVRRLLDNNAIAEKSAECIANMQLEDLDYLKEIKNPNRIQQAFILIVENLVEYRRYLPDTVLDRTGNGDGGSVKDNQSCENMRRDSIQSSTSSHKSKGNPERPVRAQPTKFNIGVQRRRVTVAAIRVHTSDDGGGNDLCDLLMVVDLTATRSSSTVRSATVQVTNDGHIYLSWNTAVGTALHATVGMDTMCSLLDGVEQHMSGRCWAEGKKFLSVGISTNVGYCGNVGSDTTRVYVVNGPVVSHARTLSRYAQELNTTMLACDSALQSVHYDYTCHKVDYIALQKGDGPMFVWDVTGRKARVIAEWMYEMEKEETTRRGTLTGLSSLMWEAISTRDVNQLKSLREDFISLSEANGGATPVGTKRLLQCTQEVIDNVEGHYLTRHFIIEKVTQKV